MFTKKIFDYILAIILLSLLSLPMILIAIAVRLTSKGPAFYWSRRAGKDNKIFKMYKFRSMSIDTPVLPTHLLNNADKYMSPIGGFLRRSSLDELPQLFSVLKGDMSFVGPRPALYNQHDLILLRAEKGVDKILPGISGWAQVNGRDKLSISEKVAFDVEYLNRQSFCFDIKILSITLLKVFNQDSVSH
ncbi:sugar transferase [Methylophilaceae bacterium]|nr:sugar transferase [Methylophilaceae bacterium]